MLKLNSWFFVVSPFNILPSIKLAIMRHFTRQPQRYDAGIWTSYEWAWFRIYYWPKSEEDTKARELIERLDSER